MNWENLNITDEQRRRRKVLSFFITLGALILIFCILLALDIWQAMSSRPPPEQSPEEMAANAAQAAKHLYMMTKHFAEGEPQPSGIAGTAQMVFGLAITFGMSIFINAVNNSLGNLLPLFRNCHFFLDRIRKA